MNKSHPTTRSGTRARSTVAAASARESLLELDDDEIEEMCDDPSLPVAILDAEESDWSPDDEDDHGARPSYRREAREFLAPEDESELNLLLHGVSYR